MYNVRWIILVTSREAFVAAQQVNKGSTSLCYFIKALLYPTPEISLLLTSIPSLALSPPSLLSQVYSECPVHSQHPSLHRIQLRST